MIEVPNGLLGVRKRRRRVPLVIGFSVALVANAELCSALVPSYAGVNDLVDFPFQFLPYDIRGRARIDDVVFLSGDNGVQE